MTSGAVAEALIDAKRIDLRVTGVMGLVAAGWTLARPADAVAETWVPAVEYHGRPIVSNDSAANHRVWIGGISLDEVLDAIGRVPGPTGSADRRNSRRYVRSRPSAPVLVVSASAPPPDISRRTSRGARIRATAARA